MRSVGPGVLSCSAAGHVRCARVAPSALGPHSGLLRRRCRAPARGVYVNAGKQPQQQQPNQQTEPTKPDQGRLAWLLKLPGVTAACTLLPTLAAAAAESYDPFGDPLLDPLPAADGSGLLGTLMFSVASYAVIILLWMWVSRYGDEADVGPAGGGGEAEGEEDEGLPGGFRQHLGANIRSYRDPREDASRRAAALVAARDLGELKEAVAAQASEHLVDQLRTKYALVCSKVSEVYVLPKPARQRRCEEAARRHDPGLDAMIERAVAELAVEGVERYSEEALVRHVMLQVAARLARDEVAACVGTLGDPELKKRYAHHHALDQLHI